MKKFNFFVALFFILATYAQEEFLFSLQAKHYNEQTQQMDRCNIEFKYNWKKDVVYFIVSEDSTYVGYLFKEASRDSISLMLEKYLTWHKKAVQMEAEVDKEINSLKLPAYFNYHSTKKIYTNGYARFTTYFLSQDFNWHQLVLKFGTIVDRHKRYVQHKPKNIYFEKSQVLELQKAFDADYLKGFKENIKEQKRIRKLFK